MLSSLHIRNYVLIDSLDIDFPEGLVIISGPTGAGKSILLGALSLLMGSKADASVISEGAQSCVVEGEFTVPSDSLAEFCRDNDLDFDGNVLSIRRVVNSTGRSRSFVGDSPVTARILEELSRFLLDIHSQRDTLLLTDRKYQLKVLDEFAGNSVLLEKCSSIYSELQSARLQISALEDKIAAASRESDYNAVLYRQLSDASLREGELASLEGEQYSLSHQEQVKQMLEQSQEIFDPSDESHPGVISSLTSLRQNLEKLGDYLPEFTSYSERIESARLEIKDVYDSVCSANDSMDCSPERLQWIEDRLSLIYSLFKRCGCESEKELIARRDELKEFSEGTEDMQVELLELQKQKNNLQRDLDSCCSELHSKRLDASSKFSLLIKQSLDYMELDRSVFRVSLQDAPQSATGSDSVEFLFNATGGTPVSVAKCASGGESSRIMLALKEQMSSCMKMPVMIFDEIDTGVSGSVADKMGSVICRMSDRMQIFAITHLPQVAAKGSAHFLVTKNLKEGKTSSSIELLTDEKRVLELARMLSASDITPEAVANARRLLEN